MHPQPKATISLVPPADRRLLAWFAGAGAGAGLLAFFFGGAAVELFTAPPYRPTIMPPPEVVAEALARVFQPPAVPAPPPPTPSEPAIATRDAGNWIRIPALSLAAPLAAPASMESEEVLRALQVGVVRYANGVEPGQPGVLAIAGHSTGEPWKGRYRFTFLNARKLQPGDEILVDHAGFRYTYRVSGSRIVDPRATPVLESAAERPQLALITCWPLWTQARRLVVDAALVGKTRLIRTTSEPT